MRSSGEPIIAWQPRNSEKYCNIYVHTVTRDKILDNPATRSRSDFH